MMFRSLVGPLAGGIDGVKSKLILYLIAGIVVLVIISLLLDGIKKFIRGLDTAALGGIFLWLGFEANKTPVIKASAPYLIAAGGTLVVTGLLAFIIIKMIRGKRKARDTYKAKHQELEREQKAQKEANAQRDAEQ